MDNTPLETSEADALPYVEPGVAQDQRVILLMGDEPEDPAAVLRKALDRLYAACCAVDGPGEGADFEVLSDEYDAAMAEAQVALASF